MRLTTRLKSDAVMASVANIDTLMLRRRPAKSREKRVLKDQLLFLKHNKVQIVCVSQDSDPKKSNPRKVGELRLNASADTLL